MFFDDKDKKSEWDGKSFVAGVAVGSLLSGGKDSKDSPPNATLLWLLLACAFFFVFWVWLPHSVRIWANPRTIENGIIPFENASNVLQRAAQKGLKCSTTIDSSTYKLYRIHGDLQGCKGVYSTQLLTDSQNRVEEFTLVFGERKSKANLELDYESFIWKLNRDADTQSKEHAFFHHWTFQSNGQTLFARTDPTITAVTFSFDNDRRPRD